MSKNTKLSNAGTDQIFNMAFDVDHDAFRIINVGPTNDSSYVATKNAANPENLVALPESSDALSHSDHNKTSVKTEVITKIEIVYVDKPFIVEHTVKEIQIVEIEKQILVPSDVKIVEIEKQVIVTNTEYKTIEIPVIVEKPTIVEKQVVVEITKEVYPNWVKILTIVQTVLIVALLIKAGI